MFNVLKLGQLVGLTNEKTGVCSLAAVDCSTYLLHGGHTNFEPEGREFESLRARHFSRAFAHFGKTGLAA
jgi:hypothetical protein